MLPDRIWLHLIIHQPTQQIATPTPWTLTAEGESPWPSHASRHLISANGSQVDIELHGPANPLAHRELPTALAEQVAEAAARAAPAIAWE